MVSSRTELETADPVSARKLHQKSRDDLDQIDSDAGTDDEEWRKPFTCRYCSRRHGWRQERDSHELNCDEFSEKCEKCQEMFTVSKQFLRHRKQCQKLEAFASQQS